MNPVRKRSAAATGVDVKVEDLRPGHIIGASGTRTIVSAGTDHDTYRSYVVRYANGERRIESWSTGSTVMVVGRDREIRQQSGRLRAVSDPPDRAHG